MSKTTQIDARAFTDCGLDACQWAEIEAPDASEEIQYYEAWIYAPANDDPDLDRAPDGDFRERHSTAPLAQFSEAAHQRDAVRAAAVGAKAPKQQRLNLGRNAVFEPLGFFVHAGPVQANDLGEKLFGQLMAQGEVFGDAAALAGQLDPAVARHAQVIIARHPLQRGGDRRASA